MSPVFDYRMVFDIIGCAKINIVFIRFKVIPAPYAVGDDRSIPPWKCRGAWFYPTQICKIGWRIQTGNNI